MAKEPEVVFVDINPENPVTKIQSLCMECGEEGTTSFLLTTIPHFREIIISSFECPNCNTKNNTIQFGGSIQPKGVHIECQIKTAEDMNRQVVKSDSATVKIPELELEIPPETQQGTLNTVEGLIRAVADGLEQLQPVRRVQVPEQAAAIDAYIVKLTEYADGKHNFTIVLDDCTGNSHVESPLAPLPDPQMLVEHYERTDAQNASLGFYKNDDGTLVQPDEIDEWRKLKENPEDKKQEQKYHSDWFQPGDSTATAIGRPVNAADVREVMTFPSHCFACHTPGEERMVRLEIPYFKEIVIMSYVCDQCGYRNNTIKAGGSIAPKGRKISLLVKNKEDLCRDMLKSDTAGLSIPEIELVVEPGSLGGRFTTVEGILQQVRDELKGNAFLTGDSASHRDKNQWKSFLDQLTECIDLKRTFTLVLDDPVSNSYVLSLTSPDPDPQITIEDYVRTAEQDADLGLDLMNTENYLPPSSSSSSDPEPSSSTSSSAPADSTSDATPQASS
jgi:zinc finger protein